MRNFIQANRKTFCIFLLLFLFAPYVLRAESVSVKVDVSKSLGNIPDILSSSVWFVEIGRYPKEIVEKFFADNNPPVIMLTMTHVLKSSSDFSDYKKKLAEYFSSGGGEELLKGAKKNNSLLVVGFDPAPLPPWLSTRAGNKNKAYKDQPFNIEELSPPKYDKWGEVIEHTMRFLKEIGLKDIGLYLGHEPNWMWLGNMESFVKYYAYAAKAAKKVDRNVKVGAVGSSAAIEPKVDCDYSPFSDATKQLCLKEKGWGTGKTPMIKAFIEQAAKNNIPVDFINWHTFQGNLYTYSQDAKTVKKWLSENRMKDVKLYVADWSYWKGASKYPADYLDGEENAAYAIDTVFNMWKVGIDWHGIDFDVRNYGDESKRISERKDAVFIGDWSMVSRFGIIKPIYNAFKALSIVSGKEDQRKTVLLDTKISGGEISAIATMGPNKDKVYVILSNYVPSFPMMKLALLHEFMDMNIPAVSEDIYKTFYSARQETSSKQRGKASKKELIDQVKNLLRDQTVKEKDPEKKLVLHDLERSAGCLHSMIKGDNDAFFSCFKEVQSSLSTKEVKNLLSGLADKLKPFKVKIEFQNLPIKGKAAVTTHTIDKNHSNPCSANKKTDSERGGSLCGTRGAIDLAVLKAKGMSKKDLFAVVTKINSSAEVSLEGSRKTREINLADNRNFLNIDMEPNSVWLIELKNAK